MSVDIKVYQLAEAILGKELSTKQNIDSLADAIQDRVEDWFESEDLEMP